MVSNLENEWWRAWRLFTLAKMTAPLSRKIQQSNAKMFGLQQETQKYDFVQSLHSFVHCLSQLFESICYQDVLSSLYDISTLNDSPSRFLNARLQTICLTR